MDALQTLIALARKDGIALGGVHRRLIVPASTPITQSNATLAHIAVVYRRTRQVARGRPREARILQLAALIHEKQGSPAGLQRAARRLGKPAEARAACRTVRHFGSLWRLAGPHDAAELARRLGPGLRLYLLFELAHEGAPPPRLRELWHMRHFGPIPLPARLGQRGPLHAPAPFVEARVQSEPTRRRA